MYKKIDNTYMPSKIHIKLKENIQLINNNIYNKVYKIAERRERERLRYIITLYFEQHKKSTLHLEKTNLLNDSIWARENGK